MCSHSGDWLAETSASSMPYYPRDPYQRCTDFVNQEAEFQQGDVVNVLWMATLLDA